MNIAVCDDQAEELETVTELLRQWQAALPAAFSHVPQRGAAAGCGAQGALYAVSARCDDARHGRHGCRA